MKKDTLIWMAALVLLLCCAGGALAHKVNLFAYVEGGRVFTESYFPDGTAVAGGRVLVYDSHEKLLLEGVTDKAGLFNFPVPVVDDLTIVIEAAMGHKNSFRLKKEEVEAGR